LRLAAGFIQYCKSAILAEYNFWHEIDNLYTIIFVYLKSDYRNRVNLVFQINKKTE